MLDAKVITVDGHGDVTIKELTPEDYDRLLNPDHQYEARWLDRILDKDNLSGAVLSAATGLMENDLAKIKPSLLRPLIDGFKEVNADFFEAARVEKARRRARDRPAARGPRRSRGETRGL